MANQKKSKKDSIENGEIENHENEINVEENTQQEESTQLNEVQKLELENKDLNDKLLRQLAEFDNFKKRTAKERLELSSFTKALCLQDFLGVIDNFERALEFESKDADFKKGIEMIFIQLKEVLKQQGVEEIDALNKPFNPELHEAISQIQDESLNENTVSQVVQKGYKLGDKVMRHAMVIVANP